MESFGNDSQNSNLSMQPPLLNSNIILVRYRSLYDLKPLLRIHLSYKANFSLSQWWPLNTGLAILMFYEIIGLFLP
jgi:hypothetical protein